ncbi:serine/threonine protein kinase, partial [Streptomyces durbertensis]
LPEVLDAELVDAPGARATFGRATRRPDDPVVRRAVEAALAAARIPDHPRLDQVFDVFVEDDGLWIVSELVVARPLAAVLAEQPLSPHRAAEIAADLLAALSAVHTFGWTHRNITPHTVLVCEDGRALLTGLASGAAEEALSGYDPLPTEGPMAPGAVSPDPPLTGPRPAVPPARGPGGGDPFTPDAPDDEGPPGGRGLRPGGAVAAYRAGAAAYRADAAGRREQGQAVAERSGPWGGDKPGPSLALPTHLGYRADTARSATDRDPLTGDPYTGGPYTDAAPAGDPYASDPYTSDPYADGGYAADAYAGHDTPGPEADAGHRTGGSPTAPRHRTFTDEDGYAGHDTLSESATPGAQEAVASSWGEPAAEDGRYRGPTTALAAERARQARMTLVGPVTERWAPEQAGPVYENWRLAPPVGPAADLWALGALLYRAVQGHAPYPEENTAELVQLVCAEPPAYAEECGPLRPVIESLLRQDPTERPLFEELSGWLRSLIRSAPEPEAGRRVVSAQLPPAGGRADSRRLPILRKRGEIAKWRRPRRQPAGPPAGRRQTRRPAERSAKRASEPRSDPRRLGRLILLAVLLLVVGVMLFAVLLMPKAGESGANQRGSVGGAPTEAAPPSADPEPSEGAGPEKTGEPAGTGRPSPDGGTGSRAPQPSAPGQAPEGYEFRDDPAGFRIAVPEGWARGQTSSGLVRFSKGGLELVVVPGRDSADRYGSDPREYQLSDQPELAGYRDSTGWKTSSGVRTITVGDTAMAEGEFGWEAGGRQLVARNRAMLLGGKYHVVMVTGPQSARAEVDERFTAVVDTYRTTG